MSQATFNPFAVHNYIEAFELGLYTVQHLFQFRASKNHLNNQKCKHCSQNFPKKNIYLPQNVNFAFTKKRKN